MSLLRAILLFLLAVLLFSYFYAPNIVAYVGQGSVKLVRYLDNNTPGSSSGSSASARKIQISSPKKYLEKFHSKYQLKPDKRISGAVVQIWRLLQLKSNVTTTMVNGTWELSFSNLLSNAQKDYMSRYPSFEEALALSEKHARMVLKEIRLGRAVPGTKGYKFIKSLSRSQPGFEIVKLHKKLRLLNKNWNEERKTVDALVQAARILVRLALVSYDETGTADLVQEKALAYLVLAETATGEPLFLERSMLSYAMGYTTYSNSIMRRLDENAPWLLYLSRNDSRLRQAKGPDAEYFKILAYARSNDFNKWAAAINQNLGVETPSIHAIASAQTLAGFQNEMLVNDHFPKLILTSILIDRENGLAALKTRIAIDKAMNLNEVAKLIKYIFSQKNVSPGTEMKALEMELKNSARKLDGPFLEADNFNAIYRGYFFSVLYRQSILFLDSLSSEQAAKDYLDALGNPGSAMGREFLSWFAQLVDSKQGKVKYVNALSQKTSGNFGFPLMYRIFEEQKKYIDFIDTTIEKKIEELLPYMDTRISQRLRYANFLYFNFNIISKAEQAYKSIEYGTQSNVFFGMWMGGYMEDTVYLSKLVNDANVSPYKRAKALSKLIQLKPDMGSAFEQIRNAKPDDWYVLNFYLEYLAERGENKKAIRLIERWRKSNTKPLAFNRENANIFQSKLLQEQGDLSAAWSVLKEDLDSYYGPSLRRAADVLLAMGKLDEAMVFAKRHHRRYPDSIRGLLAVTKILWLKGEYKQAAELLSGWKYKITTNQWAGKVGKTYQEVFKMDTEKGLNAFRELLQKSVPSWNLLGLSEAVDRAGNYELAFKTASQLKHQGPGIIDLRLKAYGFLKKWKGEGEGIKWLQNIPKNLYDYLVMSVYDSGHWELLWSLLDDPSVLRHPDALWLYRASSYVEGFQLNEERKRSLLSYYKNSPGSHYDQLGEYVLGMLSEEEIVNKEYGKRELSEVTYYLGLRAVFEKRLVQAADWFRLSLETGMHANGEYRWSHRKVSNWTAKVKSLEVLARQGGL